MLGNGNVFKVDENNAKGKAIVGDRIIAVGSNQEIDGLSGDSNDLSMAWAKP